MGHPARELPDRLHLLGLAELRLELPPLRDVREAPLVVQRAAARVPHRPHVHGDPDEHAVPAPALDLEVLERLAALEGRDHPGPVTLFRVEIRHVRVEQRGHARVARDAGGRRVGGQDAAVGQAADEPDRRAVEELVVAHLRRAGRRALPGVIDRAPDRGGQPHEAAGVLQHVVVEALAQRLHRDLLAQGPGAEDHRALGPLRLEPVEERKAVREAEAVVGDHQVERAVLEGAREALRIADLQDLELRELAHEGPADQGAIVRIVVHEQDAEPVVHALSLAAARGSRSARASRD